MKNFIKLNSILLLFSAISPSTSSTVNSTGNNQINTTTGLTAEQKNLIQKTWLTIMQDAQNIGMDVMFTFFERHPDYQKAFEPAHNVSLDKLRQDEYFQKHSLKVMNALDDAFKSLDVPEKFENTFHDLGDQHQKRGHTKEQFDDFRKVILEVLTNKFGKDFTSETSEAWTKMINAAFNGIFKAF